MKRVLSCLLCGGLLVTLTATGALAQATAQITGTVKDSSGGVLPGASVTATQTDTGFKREVVTDADGLFSFPGIPVGPYKLEVTLQGFRTSVQTGIVLQVNSNPVVPVDAGARRSRRNDHRPGERAGGRNAKPRRRPGDGQQAHPRPAVERAQPGRPPAVSAGVGAAGAGPGEQRHGRQQRRTGVLAGRRAGVRRDVCAGRRHAQRPAEQPEPAAAVPRRAAGVPGGNQRPDGAERHAFGRRPSTRSPSRARIRSGATLFEFFRHHSFNATDPFGTKNADGSRKDDGLKRNQYGATIGGPSRPTGCSSSSAIRGRTPPVNPTDNRAFVPTAAMLAGDFTAFASPACNAGVQRNLARAVRRQPGQPGAVQQGGAQHHRQAADDDRSVRPRAVRSAERHRRRAVRHQDRLHDQRQALAVRPLHRDHAVLAAAVHASNRRSRTCWPRASAAATTWRTAFTLGENYVISSTTLNAVRFAYNRTDISRPNTDFFSAPEVGINSYSYLPHYMLLTVTGGFQLGDGTETPTDIITPSWQISDDLTLVRGGHQYVFGGSFARWSSRVARQRPLARPVHHRRHA